MKVFGAYKYLRKIKPDLVVGTSILVSLLGKVLKYKSIIVNEDDFDIISKTSNLGYPFADHILSPIVCRTANFGAKTIKYNGYHELAYLHPNHFVASKSIASKYIDVEKPFFIIRFAKLVAHHDDGIVGLDEQLVEKIINYLSPYGEIYITSEIKLHKKFDKYRISIRACDIHHVMSYASIYIGDSQTMAAESGVLGIPFIRYNDFVGKISYLEELESKYKLGYGVIVKEQKKIFSILKKILDDRNKKNKFIDRKNKMLSEKIDYSSFLAWFLNQYPSSVQILKANPKYESKFKLDSNVEAI